MSIVPNRNVMIIQALLKKNNGGQYRQLGHFWGVKTVVVSLTPINYAKINYPQLFEHVKLWTFIVLDVEFLWNFDRFTFNPINWLHL